MRCPSCNKFVAYEDPHEVESSSDPTVDDDGTISVAVRAVLKCAECGEELKDAEIEATDTVTGAGGHHGEGHSLEIDPEDPEPATRAEGKGRYMKMFYGFEIKYKVTCECGASFEGTISDYEQASAMNELV